MFLTLLFATAGYLAMARGQIHRGVPLIFEEFNPCGSEAPPLMSRFLGTALTHSTREWGWLRRVLKPVYPAPGSQESPLCS